MATDKADENDLLLVTCKYCDTQTRVNPRAAEAGEAVPCCTCGARLEIELPDPWEKRVRERSELVACEECGALAERRDVYYVKGRIYCPRCNELRHVRRGKRLEQALAITISTVLLLSLVILELLAERC